MLFYGFVLILVVHVWFMIVVSKNVSYIYITCDVVL